MVYVFVTTPIFAVAIVIISTVNNIASTVTVIAFITIHVSPCGLDMGAKVNQDNADASRLTLVNCLTEHHFVLPNAMPC